MEWTSLNGRKRKLNFFKYKIDWKRKAPSQLAQTFKDFIASVYPYHIWYEEVLLPGTLLRVDFIDLTRRIAFEISGRQHEEYVQHFHKSRAGYLRQLQRDGNKYRLLMINNFKFIELFDDDIKILTKDFLEKEILKLDEN